jgi:hypothetical protein
MLGDHELLLIGTSFLLWLGAAVAFLLRRLRLARWLVLGAVALSLATLAVLRVGTGHRG